jgi:hypothetical protein
MDFVFRLENRIIRATRAIAIVGFVGLLVVALLTMLDVALRWVANAPIKGLNDISGLAIAIVIASCLPLVVAQRQNISIRFLGDALGPSAARWLDAFGSGALLAFVALIGWQLAMHTAGMAESGPNHVAPAHSGHAVLVCRDTAGRAVHPRAGDRVRRGRAARNDRRSAARGERRRC